MSKHSDLIPQIVQAIFVRLDWNAFAKSLEPVSLPVSSLTLRSRFVDTVSFCSFWPVKKLSKCRTRTKTSMFCTSWKCWWTSIWWHQSRSLKIFDESTLRCQTTLARSKTRFTCSIGEKCRWRSSERSSRARLWSDWSKTSRWIKIRPSNWSKIFSCWKTSPSLSDTRIQCLHVSAKPNQSCSSTCKASKQASL